MNESATRTPPAGEEGGRGPRRPAPLAGALAAAAALALLLGGWAVAWWWRDVPPFRGPETFLEMKGRLEAVQLQPLERGDEEETFAVELRSSRGWTVHGHLRVPAGEAAAPRPGVVVLGGIGTGQKAAHLVHTRDPHVVLGIDYPWGGSRRPGFGEILASLPEIRRSVLHTPAALLLAADYLAGRTDIQGDDLTLIGASFGAPFAVAAGALDERFGAVLLIYGGADFRTLVAANLERRYPWAPKILADLAARVMQPVEPACHLGAIAPRRVVMVNGRRDDRIPEASVLALFKAAGQPKTLVWLDTPHISPRDEALLQAIADTALHFLEALERAAGDEPEARGEPAPPPPPGCQRELRAVGPATIVR